MTVAEKCSREPKTFDHLKGLDGISDGTIEQHLKLYNGYVTNLMTVMEKLHGFIQSGNLGSPEYAELKRRVGFEINGVVLHELYFDNMKPNGGAIESGSKLHTALTENFGSYENWEADFKATGKMRGIGWAILYQCTCTGKMFNAWITDHEYGHPAGARPIMVMDVWEHAYAVDFQPTGRGGYIDAFFKNINWKEAESRMI